MKTYIAGSPLLADWDQQVLFTKIRQILIREFGSLPAKGVVAGQSVASAVYELVGLPVSTRYRDLEVFSEKGKLPAHIAMQVMAQEDIGQSSTMTKGYRMKGSCFGSFIGSFDLTGTPLMKNRHSVKTCVMDEGNQKMKFVVVHKDATMDEKKDVTPEVIVNGFDLNLVSIGIDLETGDICWTPEFQEFLLSRQIKACFYGTPMHTAVRLVQKLQSMKGIYVNLDEEMEKLQTARRLGEIYESTHEAHLPGDDFSDIHSKKAIQMMPVLDKYWSLDKNMSRHDKTYFELRPKQYNHAVLDMLDKCMPIEMFCREFETLINLYPKISEIATGKNKRAKRTREIMERMRLYGNDDDSIFKEFSDVHDAPEDRLRQHLSRSKAMMEILTNDQFDIAGYRDESIKRYIKCLERHPHIYSLLSGESSNEQMQVVNTVRWLERRRMDTVVGWIEGMRYSMEEMARPDTRKMLVKDYANHLKEMETLSVEPLLGDSVVSGCHVKELNTAIKLHYEGQAQKHCVGGYWRSINSRQCYVFSIQTIGKEDSERSTVAFEYKGHEYLSGKEFKTTDKPWMQYTIQQIQAKLNTAATKTHTRMADTLLTQVKGAIERQCAAGNNEFLPRPPSLAS